MESPTTFQKDNDDFNSIPGYIIKKKSSRGPKHGQSERQIMFFKAKDMLRKEKKKNGNHPTILSKWKAPESNRTSLAKHNIGEKEIMLYDQIALENHHDYIATTAERIQNSKHWVLSVNAEGSQLPRQRRPDYASAKRECQRLQNEYMAETTQFYKPIHPSKQMRQNLNQQFEGSED